MLLLLAVDSQGSLFETARNNGLAYARQRQDTFSKPPTLIRNEYGASFGGPVVLPRLSNGKDRTFVFAAYEAHRERRNSPSKIAGAAAASPATSVTTATSRPT
jgi:hypothetical protein